jgi:hypothetical protein
MSSHHAPWQFGLSGVFGVMTVFCLILGVLGLVGSAGLVVGMLAAAALLCWIGLMLFLWPVALAAMLLVEACRRFVWRIWDRFASDREQPVAWQFSGRLPEFLRHSDMQTGRCQQSAR